MYLLMMLMAPSVSIFKLFTVFTGQHFIFSFFLQVYHLLVRFSKMAMRRDAPSSLFISCIFCLTFFLALVSLVGGVTRTTALSPLPAQLLKAVAGKGERIWIIGGRSPEVIRIPASVTSRQTSRAMPLRSRFCLNKRELSSLVCPPFRALHERQERSLVFPLRYFLFCARHFA